LVARGYIPDAGDLIWLDFDPQAGHEQAGRRPALVLSPRIYNLKVGLAVACPITSRVKGYPFEVVIPAGLPIQGAILADQIKSLDWRARAAAKAGRIPRRVLEGVLACIAALLGLP
jgi:mRNA interferase MazF